MGSLRASTGSRTLQSSPSCLGLMIRTVNSCRILCRSVSSLRCRGDFGNVGTSPQHGRAHEWWHSLTSVPFSTPTQLPHHIRACFKKPIIASRRASQITHLSCLLRTKPFSHGTPRAPGCNFFGAVARLHIVLC